MRTPVPLASRCAATQQRAELRYDAAITDADPLRTLKDSAERLEELIQTAADQQPVRNELWREIAEAAVRVAAAAEMLAGDAEDEPTA